MPSIMVGIPSFDRHIKAKTSESLGNAIEYADALGLLDRVVHRYPGGYSVARARNFMAQWAVDENVDYLLMVDSDMVVPEDGIANLISHDVEVCLGWAVRGTSDDGLTSVVRRGGGYGNCFYAKEIAELARNGTELFEVRACGMAFALINTDVFRRFKRPWFVYEDRADGSALGEDFQFCQQCATNNVRVWVDARVGCGHIHDRILEAM